MRPERKPPRMRARFADGANGRTGARGTARTRSARRSSAEPGAQWPSVRRGTGPNGAADAQGLAPSALSDPLGLSSWSTLLERGGADKVLPIKLARRPEKLAPTTDSIVRNNAEIIEKARLNRAFRGPGDQECNPPNGHDEPDPGGRP